LKIFRLENFRALKVLDLSQLQMFFILGYRCTDVYISQFYAILQT